MRDILLDYVMKVDVLAPIPPASTSYLRKVLCVVKPLPDGETGTITECTDKTSIQSKTNAQCWKLLDAGLNSVYVLPTNTLDIADVLAETKYKFFTILIDGAFDNVEDFDYGNFEGVVGWTKESRAEMSDFATLRKNVGFYDLTSNMSENMYWAFGKLLSANNWRNQQYIEMPKGSGIDTINEAELMFDDRVSFVLSSEEYSHRLALFSSAGKAIVAPYLTEEIIINLQSTATRFIQLNQPAYTPINASLLEDALQGVIDGYIERGEITYGEIEVELTGEQFVANANASIDEPKALWRLKATIKQGDI